MEKEMFDSTTRRAGGGWSRGGSADGIAVAGDGSEPRPSVDGKGWERSEVPAERNKRILLRVARGTLASNLFI